MGRARTQATKPRSYFWDPPGTIIGVKADINRHLRSEVILDEKIAQLEAIEKSLRTPMEVATLASYRNLRAHLLASKAEAVSRLGKNSTMKF